MVPQSAASFEYCSRIMNQESETQSRFRFSLRGLIVFVLGVAIAAGYVSYQIRHAKQESEQLKKLDVLGEVSVTYHYQFNSDGSVNPNAQPRGLASWVSMLAGDQPLKSGVRWLSITSYEEDWPDLPELTEKQWQDCKTALSHFVDLETFSTEIYPWEDLDAFANTVGLKHLALAGEPMNIDGVAGLTELESLILDGWQLTDLSPLRTCIQLKSLDIGGGDALSSLVPLSTLTKLENLDLSSTYSLANLKGIQNFPNLKSLNLNQCSNLTDIAGIESAQNLTQLNLSNVSPQCDLAPISELGSLTTLKISGNPQLNLDHIRNLTQLKELEIESCDFKSLEGLENLQNLDRIHLTSNPLTDASAIHGLSRLKFVVTAGTALTDEQIEELKQKLPRANIVEFLGF